MTDSFSIYYSVSRGGATTSFTLNGYDIDHGLTLNYLGDQGFGLAPLHRITTRGPLQHGDSDIDFRLDPRILQIPLVVQNASTTPMIQSYTIRKAILDIFRPQESGTLTVTYGTQTRSINTKVLGGMSFDVDPTDYHVRTVVQLRADDPTWYDPTLTTLTVANTNFGTNRSYTQSGNWNSFPIIEVTGPITNFAVAGIPTGYIAVNSGVTIAAGVTWYFDLRYGYKTVYTGPDQTGTNVISNINPVSDLATFAMFPGSNTIFCTGSGLTAASKAVFKYYPRYTGI